MEFVCTLQVINYSLQMAADATQLNVYVLFFVVSSIVDGNFEFANRNISSSVQKA